MDRSIIRFLCKKNASLYRDITDTERKITIDDCSNDKEWKIGIQRDKSSAVIYTGKQKDDLNAFTHELLHYKLVIDGNEQVDVLYDDYVFYSKNAFQTDLLPSIFNKELTNLIDTSIQHGRMLQWYLNHGFDRNRFVYDYYRMPERIKYGEKFRSLITGNVIDKQLFYDLLYSTFFVYRYNPNSHIKTLMLNKCISPIRFLYPDLIDSFENLCKEWDDNLIEFNYTFLQRLIADIDAWRDNHGYI